MKKYKRYQQKLNSSNVVITGLTLYVEKVDARKKRKSEKYIDKPVTSIPINLKR